METTFSAIPSVEQLVRAILSETGINNPPTTPELLADYFKLEIDYFDDHKKYNLSPKIKAFLWPDRKLIGVYSRLIKSQRIFSILHEIGHFVLHCNDPSLLNNGKFIDSGENLAGIDSLSKKGVVREEIEANKFAADCLFQLDSFDRFTNINENNWSNIRIAADYYAASIEATARRWVERSQEACALVTFSPTSRDQFGSPLKILYTITSQSFKDDYFTRLGSNQELGSDSAIYRFFYRLEYFGETLDVTINVHNGSHGSTSYDAHLFSNSYRVFGLLSPTVK